MSILGLIAAFGGGVFAAAIGAVPAFIMTGVFSIVGAVAGMCGAGDASDILVNYFAFGPFFGPHIAFAGGVAAAAYIIVLSFLSKNIEQAANLIHKSTDESQQLSASLFRSVCRFSMN